MKKYNGSFKLGESHYQSPEIVEKGAIKYYPARFSKELLIFRDFLEAYKEIDKTFLDQMIVDISKALQNYNTNDVTNLTIGDFGVHIQDGDYIQSVTYNPMTKKINIFINRKCLEHIEKYQNIPNIRKRLKSVYARGFTHKQQKEDNSEDLSSSIQVFLNHMIELDTYARQYGFELRELHPNESAQDIFERIFNANIENEELKNKLIALFDILTNGDKDFFLRNMYDYINGEE